MAGRRIPMSMPKRTTQVPSAKPEPLGPPPGTVAVRETAPVEPTQAHRARPHHTPRSTSPTEVIKK